MKNEGDIYEINQNLREFRFKATDIIYKIPYLEAIKDYSNNYKKAVFLVDYKDIGKIKPHDPVFQIIHKDCLSGAKNGKLTHSGKDPYSIKLINEESERKRTVKMKNFKYNSNGNKKDVVADHTLTFDSNFECGNLHSAIKISNNEYHLFIHPDTNTGGHTQWFYFKVTGMEKGVEYIFKIMNFNK